MDANQAWQSVLGQLQMEMPRASFDTWVRDTEALSIENDVMTVSARSAYVREWLESRLQRTVERLLVGILNRAVDVQFVVRESVEEWEAQEVDLEPVQWLDYDKIVQPHKQVVVKGYLRRLGREIGPKAIWLYIGFHQAAWRMGHGCSPLFSGEIRQFSGLSNGAFWRLMKQPGIQEQLLGLVERVDPDGARRYRRGRDSRPHRAPVRYRVSMTPRLTRDDARAVHFQLKSLLAGGKSLVEALQELLATEDVMQLLTPVDAEITASNTVMDMVRLEAGDSHTPEMDHVAQEVHRRIVNCLGDIHIPHYFITQTIHKFDLTPAQAWLVTVARDLAYVNSQTGERREIITFKGGYEEMARLVGSNRYKTVQGWLNPAWARRHGCTDLSRFLNEVEGTDTRSDSDLRVESMPRTFRVLLDEPLDASGSIRLDADGSDSQTRTGRIVGANGSNMVDANGSVLNSLKHPLNTHKNTSNTRTTKTAAPAFWDLKDLLRQNNVHPKVQSELLESEASVQALISWLLFAASPQSGKLSDPLGYAISRLRQDPPLEAQGSFGQFAHLAPAELRGLIDSTPVGKYEYAQQIDHPLAQTWEATMGSHNARLPAVRIILFGED